MNRYIIGLLALVGLTILLVVLLFTGGGSTSNQPKPLYDYASSNAEVKMVVGGPIVAPQNHNSAVFDINQYYDTFSLYKGYDGQVVRSKSYVNSESSFKTFLYALYYAGFSQGQTNNQYPSDTGLCPNGDRYDFYLLNGNSQTIEHYYITNCSGLPSTYKGNFDSTLTLFNNQIPDLQNLGLGTNF